MNTQSANAAILFMIFSREKPRRSFRIMLREGLKQAKP
jgi:hypothetical protein